MDRAGLLPIGGSVKMMQDAIFTIS
jgi:hypothetical protein